MAASNELTRTVGLDSGDTIQFAEGRWPDNVGQGLSMTEEDAFDLLRPVLEAVVPGWTVDHWYSAVEIEASTQGALAEALRKKAAEGHLSEGQANILCQLAEWLEARHGGRATVSYLGI